ncbi:MAG: hypothetical protein AAFQ20_16635, partial [Bacteroidota bacterium]
MKYTVVFIGLFVISCNTPKKEAEYTYPPEWAPHEAIWTDFNYESYSGVPSEEERLILIAKLSQYVKTKVVYDNDSLMQVGRNRLVEFGGKVDSIEWIKLPYWSSWMRDPLMFV